MLNPQLSDFDSCRKIILSKSKVCQNNKTHHFTSSYVAFMTLEGHKIC